MKIIHRPADGAARVLAADAEYAGSFLRKAIGLMGRSSIPDDYALVFSFSRSGRRSIHMIGVRTPLDVLWIEAGTVVRVETLQPWRGRAAATADTVIELAPGSADDVAVGDGVQVVE